MSEGDIEYFRLKFTGIIVDHIGFTEENRKAVLKAGYDILEGISHLRQKDLRLIKLYFSFNKKK